MIRKATKKPITIEYIQFLGWNHSDIIEFIGYPVKCELESETAYVAGVAPPIFSISIETLEGVMKAMTGDYIIKGVKGEFYPCKKEIFEMSYDVKSEFGNFNSMISEKKLDEWHKVDKENFTPPPANTNLFLFTKYGSILAGHYKDGRGFFTSFGIGAKQIEDIEVTHWMILPFPIEYKNYLDEEERK